MKAETCGEASQRIPSEMRCLWRLACQFGLMEHLEVLRAWDCAGPAGLRHSSAAGQCGHGVLVKTFACL